MFNQSQAHCFQKLFLCTLLFALLFLSTHLRSAAAQEVRLTVSTDHIFAGLPFTLSVEVSDFDEDPEPNVSNLRISSPGQNISEVAIRFLGVSPSVSSFLSIINGRRTERKEVKFVYQYRVTVPKPGQYEIAPVAVTQGNVEKVTPPSRFQAEAVPNSTATLIELELPERALWVGEAFDLKLHWYLNKDARDQTFVIPMFNMEEIFEIAPSMFSMTKHLRTKKTLTFTVGRRELDLPYERSQVEKDGRAYTRFTFTARMTPEQPGVFDLPPARVLVRFQDGPGRSPFGLFGRQDESQFQSLDIPRTVTVLPLPEKNRPESFTGAIGLDFGFTVKADRTVVQVGDPITLAVTLRSRDDLEGIGVPPLSSEGVLLSDHFSYLNETPVGDLGEDGVKKFHLQLRVKSNEVNEIPPLPFSFFNPEKGVYQTVWSQPIALSVKGATLVDAEAVVVAKSTRNKKEETKNEAPTLGRDKKLFDGASLIGADLSLSDPGETLREVVSLRDRMPLIVGLYFFPVVILLWRGFLRQTEKTRGLKKEVQASVRRYLKEVHLAESEPAREAGPRIANAIRQFRMTLGIPPTEGESLIQRCENTAFDPAVRGAPLPEKLIQAASKFAVQWEKAPQKKVDSASSAGTFLFILFIFLGPLQFSLFAQTGEEQGLQKARETYAKALLEKKRDRRIIFFAEAQNQYRELSRHYPNRPNLYTDWGNAALGAREMGMAVLAYRKALSLEPGHRQARKNLSWIQGHMPGYLPVPENKGTGDSLLSIHQRFSRTNRMTAGALFFALAVLWMTLRGEKMKRLRWVALFPSLVWLGLTASFFFEGNGSKAAVVLQDGSILRSADSIGAARAFQWPLPTGTEMTILETRDAWDRVELANGTRGWLKKSASVRIEND